MTNPNALPLPDLYDWLTADGVTAALFRLAREEDLGPDNLDATTSAMRLGDLPVSMAVVSRESGVAAGLCAIDDLLVALAPNTSCGLLTTDGSAIRRGQALATLQGPAGEVLALERTLLNLLGRLCGIASLTRRFVGAVTGTGAMILDTRKTTPGWRALEKFAVRCGGGHCQRMGLYDAVLIKDNHLALAECGDDLAGVVRDAARRARSAGGVAFVEVEVDTLDQLAQLLTLEPGLIDIALLDNMPPGMLTEAVAMRSARAPSVLLEASGGVTLDTIGDIARTGVDRISIGALTHQAVSIDIGLDAR
jgi:nicotinate-nucleotide pyrophosphorylase (carboxylating)